MDHISTHFTLTRRKPMEQYGHLEATVEHEIMHEPGDDVEANSTLATEHVRRTLTQLMAGKAIEQPTAKQVAAVAATTIDTPQETSAAPKPRRGRPPKPKVSAELAADIAKVEALDVAPPEVDVAAAESEAGMTPKELQDYIMSLVHRKLLDPQHVKEKVYPKYSIARALDLKAGDVDAVKADIDALAKVAAPPKPANDLDL